MKRAHVLKKRSFIVIVLAMFFGLALNAETKTYYVDINGDDTNGDGTEGNPFQSPDVAYFYGTNSSRAASGDTVIIHLKASATEYTVGTEGDNDGMETSISGINVVIEGEGMETTTISGSAAGSKRMISPLTGGSPHTLKNLTVKDFDNTQYGSIAYCKETLNLENVKFSNNRTTGGGGGVTYADNNAYDVSITGCIFENCSAGGSGGAIWCRRNYTKDLNLTIKDTRFTGCTSSSGGAICDDYSTFFSIDKCTFENCSATNRGGAINFKTEAIERAVYINNSTFKGCTTDKYGSAVSIEKANNTAAKFFIVNSTVSGCTSTDGTGAISSNNYSAAKGSLYLVNSICVGNSGGDLRIGGASPLTMSAFSSWYGSIVSGSLTKSVRSLTDAYTDGLTYDSENGYFTVGDGIIPGAASGGTSTIWDETTQQLYYYYTSYANVEDDSAYTGGGTFIGTSQNGVARDDLSVAAEGFITMGAYQLKEVETPVIGLETEFSNGVLNLSVENEVGVSTYLVSYVVDDITHEIEVVANGTGSYAVELSENAVQVKATVVDNNGYQQEFTVENIGITSVSINLAEGWNLLSVPFADADLSELTSGFWTWNGTSYVSTGNPETLQGFWYYSDKDKKVEISGVPQAEATSSLNKGWNLVGPSQNMNAPEDVVIYTWGDKVYDQILNCNEMLIMGKGYWIYSNDEATMTW